MRAVLPLALVLLSVSACMDSSRVNTTCMWTERSVDRLDPTRSADREHLRRDVALAGELGVRQGDLVVPHFAAYADPVQERCTAAMMDTIARRHGVPIAKVKAAALYRVWWADVLAVYLPLAVIVGFAMDRITRRICRAFDPEDRVVATASLSCFAVIVALVGLGVGQSWGFTVEGMFLRNGHVAFRAFLVPITRHGWTAYFSLLGLCGLVAVLRFMRTPLRKVSRSYDTYLRPAAKRAVAQARAGE